MVKSCSAYGCTNRFSKNGISFHKFPLKDKSLLRKWIVATKRENFQPTFHSYLCGEHFLPSDFNFSKDKDKPHLLPNAVPSIFTFPEKVIKKTSKRKAPSERRSQETDESPVLKKSKASPPPCPQHQHPSPRKVKLRRRIKTLKQKLRRKERKIDCLADLIKKLKDEMHIANDVADLLEQNFSGISCEIFKSELVNKDRSAHGHRYSDEIKKFALTLHFYSPHAYNFVRSILSLPCPSSLAHWTSSVNCEPGFFLDVFTFLQERAKDDLSYRDCALIFDGMYIKAGVVYNQSDGCYDGFVNFGKDISATDPDVIATEVLVFMLVGLQGHWKVPIGYFLINSITATNLYCLTSKALSLASCHGLNIYSISCDGYPSNIDSMRYFGCEFGTKVDDIKSSFSHDTYDHPLFFIPDACHMLKLARNSLADLKVFLDDAKCEVKWDHIKILHAFQEDEGLKIGNKLAKGHIEFQRQKMNVKVAAQTLSSSVADAIEYLMTSGHPKFADAEGTIRFIRIIDKLFDLLNSRNPFGKGFKKPLFLYDAARWKSTIDTSTSYLLSLTDKSGVPLIRHRRKTFILGFIAASKSVRELAYLLLTRKDNPFQYILTYKFSQDHLELLFACIRGKNGFNNNPNVQQLKSSLKRILLRNSIVGSKHGNCLTFQDQAAGSIFALKWTKRRAPLVEKEEVPEEDSKYIEYLTSTLETYELTAHKQAIIGYIAGYIVRKLSKTIQCPPCNAALYFNPATMPAINDHYYSVFSSPIYFQLINSKNRGGLLFPSLQVVKIVNMCEKAFRVAVMGVNSGKHGISSKKNLRFLIIHLINQELARENFFPQLQDHMYDHEILTEDLHSSQLLKKIIDKYVGLRLITYGKHYTKDILNKDKIGVRQQATKMVLFKGI